MLKIQRNATGEKTRKRNCLEPFNTKGNKKRDEHGISKQPKGGDTVQSKTEAAKRETRREQNEKIIKGNNERQLEAFKVDKEGSMKRDKWPKGGHIMPRGQQEGRKKGNTLQRKGDDKPSGEQTMRRLGSPL